MLRKGPPRAGRFRTRFQGGRTVDPAPCGKPSNKGLLTGQGDLAAKGRFMERASSSAADIINRPLKVVSSSVTPP
jgi:hypothetical protein